ncbi:hypothetical protein ACFFOP_37675, partial [Sinosporangium siamense]
MRVLFVSYAEKTHFIGMVPLAWALHNAGHEVRVASHPELTSTITHAGLTAVPVGKDHHLTRVLDICRQLGDEYDFDMAENRPEHLPWDHLKPRYRGFVVWWARLVNDSILKDVTDFSLYWRPDLVIWEPVTFAGPIAAKAVGAAHARFMWGLDVFARIRSHYLRVGAEQPPAQRQDSLADWINARGEQYGVEFSEDMSTGHFTLDYTPPSMRFDLDYHHVPLRYVPYNGTGT